MGLVVGLVADGVVDSGTDSVGVTVGDVAMASVEIVFAGSVKLVGSVD